jgi:hypothetical protein
MAVVFAAALAFGLAFGLGGRDTAGEMVRRAYHRTREAAPRIERAAETGTEIAANETAQQYNRRATDRPAFGDD